MARLILICALLFSTLVFAQGEDGATLVARAYFKALQSSGIPATVRFLHPDETKRFKQMLFPVFESEVRRGKRELLDRVYGPDSTIEKAGGDSDEAFLMRALTVWGASFQNVKWLGADFLGSVREGETVHVVVRMYFSIDELQSKKMTVLSFRRYGTEWRLLLSAEIEGISENLRRKFEAG